MRYLQLFKQSFLHKPIIEDDKYIFKLEKTKISSSDILKTIYAIILAYYKIFNNKYNEDDDMGDKNTLFEKDMHRLQGDTSGEEKYILKHVLANAEYIEYYNDNDDDDSLNLTYVNISVKDIDDYINVIMEEKRIIFGLSDSESSDED